MNKSYNDKKKMIVMLKLVFIGGINWGLIGLTNINFIKQILIKFNIVSIEKIIYIIVGISAYLLFKRDVFLPFLGDTVIPTSILTEKTPSNPSIEKTINNIPPNTKVLYWAAEPSNEIIDNPWEAYDKYDNSGITTSNDEGIAILKVREPSSYRVPYKNKKLEPHIHYRYVKSPGMMSRIETINI